MQTKHTTSTKHGFFAKHRTLACTALLMSLLVGCGDGAANKTADQQAKEKAKAAQEKALQAKMEKANAKPMNAQHILVQYRGCEGAQGITRNKQEAEHRANELRELALAEDADFSKLAMKHSEDPSASSGGHLGNFKPSEMVGQFVAATKELEVGQISKPIQTQFGFHIIRRLEVAPIYNAAHILILHGEAEQAPEAIKLTREEAMAIATEIYKLCEEGKPFGALAVKHSNGPAAKRGGQMGNFTVAQLPSYFAKVGEVCSTLEINEVSKPFETDFGIHLVRRNEIPKPPQVYGARHILVMHKNALRADKSCTRTKEEALRRMELVQGKLEEGGDFEGLAREYSDCPSGESGGDLGTFLSTQMVPEFSKATDKCKLGEYTDIIESPFGYHIIYRYK